MKVAITVWGNRISPVFDAAQTLLVAEIRRNEIISRKIEMFQAGAFNHFIELLADLDVQVLICGALSGESAAMLEAIDIEVISFLTGEAEVVLSLFVKGMDLAEFIMPGCPRKGCCWMRQRAAGEGRIRR